MIYVSDKNIYACAEFTKVQERYKSDMFSLYVTLATIDKYFVCD